MICLIGFPQIVQKQKLGEMGTALCKHRHGDAFRIHWLLSNH